jgi:hypothetical protein
MPADSALSPCRGYEDAQGWADAEGAYRRMLALDDRQAPVFARPARVLERQRRWDEAAEAHRDVARNLDEIRDRASVLPR